MIERYAPKKAGWACTLIAITFAVGVVVAFSIVRRGFSARDQPSAVEALAARTMRRLAVPRRAKSRANPFYPSDEVLGDARAHFADHCAVCHASDGRGNTIIGRHL